MIGRELKSGVIRWIDAEAETDAASHRELWPSASAICRVNTPVRNIKHKRIFVGIA